jgi:uncharacterized protein YecE (DUF72 family)
VIRVGTAGWEPPSPSAWYPHGLPAEERLSFYAERFEVVEVNTSFYAVPPLEAVARWVERTHAGFVFDVKLHRLLSHHVGEPDGLPAGLREHADVDVRGRVVVTPPLVEALAEAQLDACAPLVEAGRLGALLLQLSPSFAPGRHELDELLPLLDVLRPHRVAVELRHRDWLAEERIEATLGFLEECRATFVGVDASGEGIARMPPLDAVTTRGLAYLRALGRDHALDDAELGELAARAGVLAREADAVHVIVVSNAGGAAPVAARRLRELLGQAPPPLDDVAPGQLSLPFTPDGANGS